MRVFIPLLAILLALALLAAASPETLSRIPLFSYLSSRQGSDTPAMKVIWQRSGTRQLDLGLLPYRTDEELAEEFAPLTAFLGRHLDLPVRLQIADDYRSLLQLLESGKVQVAWLGTALLEGWSSKDQVEVLCHPIQRGRAHYRAAILVRAEAPFHKLADLTGHRMAYVDRNSGSGFLYPARTLRAEGMDPVASFSDVLFTGNHSRSLEALQSGEVDAAAIFIDSGDESGIPSGTRSLAWTPWIPTDPIVVRRDVPVETRRRLKDLLVNIGQHAGGLEAMQHLKSRRGYEGFLPEEESK